MKAHVDRQVTIRPVAVDDAAALATFFGSLRAGGAEKFFHPHALDEETAAVRARYVGQDIYLLLTDDSEILAYGMLRGWDEGYSIPSLGIAVRPDKQGLGLGRRLMEALHHAAAERGASRVRLRVHPQNDAAIKLYRSIGYLFDEKKSGDILVGYLDLAGR